MFGAHNVFNALSPGVVGRGQGNAAADACKLRDSLCIAAKHYS